MLSAKHKKYFKNQDVFYTCNNKQRGVARNLHLLRPRNNWILFKAHLSAEIFADISRRAIKPRLYNTKEKKTVIRHSVRRQPFSAVLQIMYRTFPIRASADRENTAHLPTERIRQKQRCRKWFSAACGIKSFNSLSWRSGFGGIKGEKERFVFERFFVGTERRKPFFALFAYLYGKKRQNVTRKSFVLQKIHKTHASTGKNNGAVRNLRLLQPRNNWILFTARLFYLHSSVLFHAECTNKDHPKRRKIKRGQ